MSLFDNSSFPFKTQISFPFRQREMRTTSLERTPRNRSSILFDENDFDFEDFGIFLGLIFSVSKIVACRFVNFCTIPVSCKRIFKFLEIVAE